MNQYKDILLQKNSTIKEALEVIDKGAMRIAIVLDDDEKVIGTLSDGDIRRGLLHGLHLDSSIESLYFKDPTLANINDSKEIIIQKALRKQIYQIPIVDNEGKLVKIEEPSWHSQETLQTSLTNPMQKVFLRQTQRCYLTLFQLSMRAWITRRSPLKSVPYRYTLLP